MEAIKNRYDFVFLFDVKDGNPNGDPDFDNMPRTDEETNHGLVTDVCIKRKIRNYVQLSKGFESPYDIFIREGNVLNSLIQEVKDEVIKKIKDESALNNFEEYTMLKSRPITKYYGFTEEEVKDLCKRYDMDFETTKEWYNGYLIDGMHMYNPNSVSQAMKYHDFDSYWRNTSAFGTINNFIMMNYSGLKEDVLTMLSGGKVMVDTECFQNDLAEIHSKDDALTALIHLGYLPNYEVAKAFQSALKTGEWKDVAASISKCDTLLMATISGNTEKVAELIELAHDTYTSILKYNDENSLSCVLTMAYFTAPAYYTIIREMPAGKGFADFVFLPRANAGNRPAMIVELKYNQSADTAIRQIKEKRYQGALVGYEGKILLVGISYDSEKHHTCSIEEW